jgi:hypothetical protein
MISLTCALLATLLQQWARRYLRVTCPRYSPHKRARVRAFYAEGVEKLHFPWAVEMLPILLHISLFLFFAGLSVFLFGVNMTIFRAVIAWVGLCVILYAWLTFLPIFHKNSPYTSPLSGPVSFCVTGIRYALFRLLERFAHLDASILRFYRASELVADQRDNFFSHSLRKTAEGFASRMDSLIDFRSLKWTFDSLDEDNELETFFEGVPGFCNSRAVANPQEGFIRPNETLLSLALIGLMDRTLTSNLVPEFVKHRRVIICTKVMEATTLLGPWYTLRRVLLDDWHGFLKSVEFGAFVLGLKDIPPITAFYAKCVVAVIISTVQERDERWVQLVLGQLKVSMPVVRGYLAPAHRDSVPLATLIHVSRQTMETCSGLGVHRARIVDALTKTVESVCKLDLQRTSSDLQHDFCGLWNQLVDTLHNDQHSHVDWLCLAILKNIRKVYIVLHEGTDALPTEFANLTDDRDPNLDDRASYPQCTIKEHQSDPPIPPLHINEPAVNPAGNATHTASGSTALNTTSLNTTSYVVGPATPVNFPIPSFYPHPSSTSAPPYPPPIPFGYPVDPRAHGIATLGVRTAYSGLSAAPIPFGIPHPTIPGPHQHVPVIMGGPAPIPGASICGKAMIPTSFCDDSKGRPEMQAQLTSTPGVASSPLQDDKSSQSQSSDSSREDIHSGDAERTP